MRTPQTQKSLHFRGGYFRFSAFDGLSLPNDGEIRPAMNDTLSSKATGTKRNIITSLCDGVVMYTMYHLVDDYLQF